MHKNDTTLNPSDAFNSEDALNSADAFNSADALESADAIESEDAIASTGGVDDESVTVSMEKEPWPEGGVDSFTNHALPSLVFGMLGIFLVLGLIAIATVSLNKIFPGKKDK